MKVCVVGAGAIGGLLAVKLALAGETVSVIDRDKHLAAIRSKGLHLHWHDGTVLKANVKAFDRAVDAGEQDLVVLGVKAYDLDQVARDVHHLLGPKTIVMTVQNGIPWWYFHKEGGSFDGRRLESLDPTGLLSEAINADRIIGCVAYPAAAVTAPGVIEHVEGERFPVGEIDRRESERAKKICDALITAGLSRACSPTFATRCGSRRWAASRSIPSARSRTPPWRGFAATPRRGGLR